MAVTYQDDKPVRVNDANKEIVISKIPNNKNLSETYIKHELASNGTVLVSIATSKKDESGVILKVMPLKTDSVEDEEGVGIERCWQIFCMNQTHFVAQHHSFISKMQYIFRQSTWTKKPRLDTCFRLPMSNQQI